jgi:hypothetical protein
VVETVAYFAMHRFSAPASEMDDDATRAVVLDMLVAALRPA